MCKKSIIFRFGLSFILLYLISYHSHATKIILPPGLISVTDRPAPAFTLSNMDGESYRYETTSKHWRFVHFWASWCGPCRKEIPALQNMITHMRGLPLEVVIINTAEDEDTVFSFLGGIAPDMNSLLDTDGLVTEKWQPRGLPSTYLVDPLGQIRYVALGGRPWDEPVYINFLKELIK